MEKVEVSVILPMFNEADSIENCVHMVKSALESFSRSYEIIIAEDGSTDKTSEKARKLAAGDERIIHLHSATRLGRGEALKRAIERSKGQVVSYVDADLSVDPASLKRLINTARGVGGMSTGSRLIKGSVVKRYMLRKLLSNCYNLIVRFLFHDGVNDHQCGFKAFTRSLLENVHAENGGWIWDTEMIVRAKSLGYVIREIPIRCTDMRGSDKSKVKVLPDAVKMWSQVFRLRLKLDRESDRP